MSKAQGRLSYANVVATIALVLAHTTVTADESVVGGDLLTAGNPEDGIYGNASSLMRQVVDIVISAGPNEYTVNAGLTPFPNNGSPFCKVHGTVVTAS